MNIFETKTFNNGRRHFYFFGKKFFSFKSSRFIQKKHIFIYSSIPQAKPSIVQNKTIDIIIPVYNGFEYLEPLFKSIIENTDLDYKVFIVDDCSTDLRISPLLEYYEKNMKDKFIVLRNEENQGFIKTVNSALMLCNNNVALLNTDIILPKKWASKLFAPIFENEKIASVTPFSNSATIFSLPNIGDNDFTGDIESINSSLANICIPTDYIKLPTAVGFCMAMSIHALKQIGFLDERFGKGYGEENDWCMRAIKSGFINTIAPNLFVWHKHGASFSNNEKKDLLKKNSKLLDKKHPDYFIKVRKTIHDKDFMSLRFYAEIAFCNSSAQSSELWFDHMLGGGTETYTINKINEKKNDTLFLRIQNNGNKYFILSYFYKEYTNKFKFTSFELLETLLSNFRINTVVINSLVGYHNEINILNNIKNLKTLFKARLSFKCHDYHALSPCINLLDYNGAFCNYNFNFCNLCLQKHKKNLHTYDSALWQKKWQNLLENEVDEIIAFSLSTKSIFLKIYPSLAEKISVVPHISRPLREVFIKSHSGINIAILGTLSNTKGLKVIKEMAKHLSQYKNVSITIIGKSKSIKFIKSLGSYERDNLPSIMEKHHIDIIFIPSIWPETFSYTTDEAMLMGLPVACFNLGAPAERVALYEKGLVIDKIDAEYALKQIVDFIN